MYAIVKTGGKQYRVAPGDVLNVEKLPGEVGDKVTLDAVCIVDGKKVEADPSKAGATKVEAEIVEQFKDKKILVFKFKKRKNYKRLQGHRQNMTRIAITAVGSEKAAAPKKEEKAEKKPAAKKTTAKKDSEATDTGKKPAAKKATAAKKTTTTKKATAAKKAEKPAKEEVAADDKASEE